MNTLALQQLSVGYRNRLIVKHIDASLTEGEVGVIIGKNGAGKTTLLKTLLGIIPPIEGSILWNQQSLKTFSAIRKSKTMAVVFSNPGHTLPISTLEFILHGRYPYNHFGLKTSARTQHVLDEIVDFLAIKDLLSKSISQLSDGNFKKVAIARAFMQNTPCILLDEPLAHLDESNKWMILEVLQQLAKKHQKMIVFTSHNWKESLSIADALWLIKDNKCLAGFTEDIAYNEDIITHLGHSAYAYDYQHHQYRKKDTPVVDRFLIQNTIQDDAKEYWLRQLLRKHHIQIDAEAPKSIEITQNAWVLHTHEDSKEFINLQELIAHIV